MNIYSKYVKSATVTIKAISHMASILSAPFIDWGQINDHSPKLRAIHSLESEEIS